VGSARSGGGSPVAAGDDEEYGTEDEEEEERAAQEYVLNFNHSVALKQARQHTADNKQKMRPKTTRDNYETKRREYQVCLPIGPCWNCLVGSPPLASSSLSGQCLPLSTIIGLLFFFFAEVEHNHVRQRQRGR
jgi:hypothetical protein